MFFQNFRMLFERFLTFRFAVLITLVPFSSNREIRCSRWLILECYALYQSPTQILKQMRERYGDNAPTYHQILAIRKKHRKEILDLRIELEAELPIMDPKQRWAYLQDVVDKALEGQVLTTKSGDQKVERDLKTALQAVKIANDMTEVKGVVLPDNDEIIRQIVMEAYDELKKAKPTADELEIIDELRKGLGTQAEPFIKDLSTMIH